MDGNVHRLNPPAQPGRCNQIAAPRSRTEFRVGQPGSLMRDTPEGRGVINYALLALGGWCRDRGIPWKG
jgi:hypothetical protein